MGLEEPPGQAANPIRAVQDSPCDLFDRQRCGPALLRVGDAELLDRARASLWDQLLDGPDELGVGLGAPFE